MRRSCIVEPSNNLTASSCSLYQRLSCTAAAQEDVYIYIYMFYYNTILLHIRCFSSSKVPLPRNLEVQPTGNCATSVIIKGHPGGCSLLAVPVDVVLNAVEPYYTIPLLLLHAVAINCFRMQPSLALREGQVAALQHASPNIRILSANRWGHSQRFERISQMAKGCSKSVKPTRSSAIYSFPKFVKR